MNAELSFEAAPFEFQELSSQESGFELEEEAGRRGGARTQSHRSAARPHAAQAKRWATASTHGKPGSHRFQPRRVSRYPHASPWGATGAFPIEPEPYPAVPALAPSEHMRWVQGALNDILGLQLPKNGIADPPTRALSAAFSSSMGFPPMASSAQTQSVRRLQREVSTRRPAAAAAGRPVEPPAAAPSGSSTSNGRASGRS